MPMRTWRRRSCCYMRSRCTKRPFGRNSRRRSRGRRLVRRIGRRVLEGAVFVVGFVLAECLLHTANQRCGVELGADNLVGAVAVYGHPVVADKGNMLVRVNLLDR